jgi:hypothetical protein
MSEIIEAIADMIHVIADNPASILIVLGFISIVIAVLIPLQIGAQILLGCLGFFMLLVGIILHAVWLRRKS